MAFIVFVKGKVMRVYVVREANFASIEGVYTTLANAVAFTKTKMHDLPFHEEYLAIPDHWGVVFRLRFIQHGAIAYDVVEMEVRE